MLKSSLQIIKFAPKGSESFHDAVKQRVDEYFRDSSHTKYGNLKMYIKTAVMLGIYFVPYFLIVTGIASVSLWFFFALWLIMGAGIAGIGTSVMHDSNHGAYSSNAFINRMLGGVLNVLGGYSRNWRIQHNILHHTYTNVEGLDEDIDAGVMLRMSPHKKWKKIYKYQYIYAWPLYALMNIFWVTVKDYKMLFKYNNNGMLKKERITLKKALVELTSFKVFYFIYILALPMFFASVAWYWVLLGFVLMHMVAGFMLACIFQLAHVMETSEYPLPPESRKMDNSWAVHQLLNTTNFAPRSTVMSWFIGGLNYQIEHHLFPFICHVHYPELSKIVEATAKEHNIPYNVQPTFLQALREHTRMLKKLGVA